MASRDVQVRVRFDRQLVIRESDGRTLWLVAAYASAGADERLLGLYVLEPDED